MKIPNWIKVTLWLLMIVFFSSLIIQRYDAITSGASNATDMVLFLIWIALIAAFIFQEVDFFGVRLKREIDNLKSDFKEQIVNLRSDIQNTINMKTEVSPHIYLQTLPSDSELPSIEERIKPMLKQTLKELGIEKSFLEIEEIDVPNDTQLLFSIRYIIENEMRRIWINLATEMRLWRGIEDYQIPRTVFQMANGLTQMKIISPELLKVIRDVYSICSSAIHGGDVTEAKVKFVRDVAPDLIATLKATWQR
ncbi:hypothetical protein ACFLUS_02900 [Chloroflexota bacterium]